MLKKLKNFIATRPPAVRTAMLKWAADVLQKIGIGGAVIGIFKLYFFAILFGSLFLLVSAWVEYTINMGKEK